MNAYAKGLFYSHFFYDFFVHWFAKLFCWTMQSISIAILDAVSNTIYHVILQVMCIFLYSALRERAVVEGIKPTTEKTHRGNPIKRAKWHLGIRSQSKPQDIMNEVYRAMKTLNFVSLGNCRKKYLAFILNQTFFL